MDFEDSEIRQLLPGLAYTLPQKAGEAWIFCREPRNSHGSGLPKDLPVADALMRSCAPGGGWW